MNVVIESRGARPVTDPELVEAVDGLAAHLESLPEVGKAVSLADPLRQIHGGFADDPAQPLLEPFLDLPPFVLRVSFDTDAFWKSALPKNGTVVSSWTT